MSQFSYEYRKRVYEKAIEKYGAENQVVKAVEELGEAVQALCKMLLGCEKREHLAEELADVSIMVEQMRMIFNINDSVDSWMDYKVAALKRKVEK